MPGNHDLDQPYFGSCTIESVTAISPRWLFAFADSNHAGRHYAGGLLVEREDRPLAARHGSVEATQLTDLLQSIDQATAFNVFVWVHHPPVLHPSLPAREASDFYRSVAGSLAARPHVRALAFGHLHCAFESSARNLALYACPSTWLSIDFASGTIAPPGYRTYELHDDGVVDAQVHWVSDTRYAEQVPMPAWVMKHVVEM